ncbi:DUF6262 family protein [Crystallibacter degradans]|uniref:DUF6262 family protein n=1 Tax=Crystallibacter degradans TaxID=2726743 RepID=UPI001473F568|nr:DUF6262 family protein [Arthrobacter sp. SF27]NMR32493.1 hypothetical protein [Arthrobacter sp. SF27]
MNPPASNDRQSARRTENLIAAKKADSRRKRDAVFRSITALAGESDRITIPAVARHAGVSTWLIHNVPELKQAVHDAARRKTGKTNLRAGPARDSMSVSSLTNELAHLAVRLRKTTAERDKYKDIIKSSVGAQLEQRTTDELTTRIQGLEDALARARNQLQESEQQLTQTQDKLEDAVDQLRAARRNNRILIQDNNKVTSLHAQGSPTG